MAETSAITPFTENNTSGYSESTISPSETADINSKAIVTENIVVNIPEAATGKNNSSTVCCSQPTSVQSTTTTTTTLTVSLSPPKSTLKKTLVPPAISPPPPPPPPKIENNPPPKSRRSSEVSTRSLCPVCQNEAVKKKNTLKCSVCTNFVHFTCSNLPPYMLHSLCSSAKKYTCEACTATPESFLTGIVTSICGNSASAESTNVDVAGIRIETLEHKVNSILVVLEKFDIKTVAENLNALGNKIEQTNNNLTGNVRAIQKMKVEQEVPSIEVKSSSGERQTLNELECLRNDLETVKKEFSASRNSNELLMTTVTERDKLLVTLREKFEKNVQKLNERERRLTILETEKQQLQERNTSLNEQIIASEQYEQKIGDIQNKFLAASNKLNTTLEVNNSLKEQVKELIALNKSLQDSINRPPARRDQRASRERTAENESEEEDEEETDGRDEVVILHDSLCRNVNDTLLSKEEISVKKIWAPDIERMEDVLDEVNSKVIVLEAFTRDLDKMETEEMNQKIVGLVSKAASRADKVVLNTIIRREDIEDIDLKADVVNAFIKLKYKRDENVIVCDNHKLHDSRLRREDKLHLNDDGVTIFATNLKYAIAKASGVQVVQKERRRRREYGGGYRQYDNRYNRR